MSDSREVDEFRIADKPNRASFSRFPEARLNEAALRQTLSRVWCRQQGCRCKG